jgi:hypothetical protein
MWCMTVHGFYSAVVDTTDKTGRTLVVRSRQLRDLENLQKVLSDVALERKLDVPIPSIGESTTSDYKYRVRVHRETWKLFLDSLTDEMDYPNFKSAVGKRSDQVCKLNAYHKVWHELYRLQEPKPQPEWMEGMEDPFAFTEEDAARL